MLLRSGCLCLDVWGAFPAKRYARHCRAGSQFFKR